MPAGNQHIITATEIGSLGTLGFMLEVPAGVIPEGFLNLHFGGLEVSGFLGQVDALLAPLAVPPTRKKLTLDDPPPVLVLSYISGDLADTATTLVLKRTFTRDAGLLRVSHDYFILPEAARKQKIGRKVLAACLDQYERMGVAKILVHAGLEDGGYVWAKAGFRAVNRSQVDVILKAAETALPPDEYRIVKVWYDDHYNNFPALPFNMEDWAGLTFMVPILRGSDWNGEINLTDDEELRNFKQYVSRS